ncbi:hypothetical protein BWQ96_01161 [Gracilariopsis chorda]|uniref:Uncharacterized protein n=1 Tax=Gracilariopsis chorda TaxID=448386 RepID=A0A2V3J3Y8_9FLOR|nr:hypothetical protein BWQ96_01161 [Gracilariopsis chorda]|eukprot:PXF49023.1 hypothetical protein BWQ96_01161 [Gracilariopsis chorda]
MQGDSFSDPRRRSSRRRGSAHSGGRRGSRGRGGRGVSRGTSRRNARKVDNLGSNEYRYRKDVENENDYDTGLDFEEATKSSTGEDIEKVRLSDTDLLSELNADFSGLEKVLKNVPLWVKLGDSTRFALGVPDTETVSDYLDPFEPHDDLPQDVSTRLFPESLLDGVEKLSLDSSKG